MMCNTCFSSENVLLYRYVVREIEQMSTSTVDACRVGSVACVACYILVLSSVPYRFSAQFNCNRG